MAILESYKPATTRRRVILFGSECGFSLPFLKRLLAERVTVAALVMPGITGGNATRHDFPVTVEQANSSRLASLATAHTVPVLRMDGNNDPRLAVQLSGLDADILLVACFPLHLPGAIRRAQRSACWNLHPSLLPRYRGPDPLFWQLRNRERNTGVTLHEVSERFDSGDILGQEYHALPTDICNATLGEWVAEAGVNLFLKTLDQYRRGCLVKSPQHEADASYYPRLT